MSDPIPTPLKPCPFCGSAGVLIAGRKGFLIMCQNTEAPPCDIGNTHSDWTEAAAIEMWNRRDERETIRLRAERADLSERFRIMLDTEFCAILNEAQTEYFARWIAQDIAAADQPER